MIRITYACGHHGLVSPSATSAPLCICGESRVQAVQAAAPRFTGTCRGPYATTTAMDPGTVNLAPAGPLRVKES